MYGYFCLMYTLCMSSVSFVPYKNYELRSQLEGELRPYSKFGTMCNMSMMRLNLISLCTRWVCTNTYNMYVLIISNETKLCLMLPVVAEFGFMWFPNASPFYSDGDVLLEIHILCPNSHNQPMKSK